MTSPSIARSIGVPDTVGQPRMAQSFRQENIPPGTAPTNLETANQDPEFVQRSRAQRSDSVATVPTTAGYKDDQQGLSTMLRRALQVHDSMLSQLKRNETLIRELQGQAENGESGVSGEHAASNPGSSSLRNSVAPLSTGQEAVDRLMPGMSRAMLTNPVRRESVAHP